MSNKDWPVSEHEIGVVRLHVLYDDGDRPVNMRIKQVNDGYMHIVGLTRTNVEGKLFTDVFGATRVPDTDYLAIYGHIARHGGEANFDTWFGFSKKWLHVYAYRTGRDECSAIFADITRQKEAVRRLRLAMEIAHLGEWEWSVKDNQVYLSPQWKALLGYADDELPSSFESWAERLHPDEAAAAIAALNDFAVNPQGTMRNEFRLLHRDGSYRWMVARAVADLDEGGNVVKIIGTILDVTQQKEAERRVKEAAQHDLLTGLPNRALIFEYAGHLLAAAARNHSRGALLFIDLDRFKTVNDVYGHEVGDRLLKEVANRIRSCVRHEDLIGRLGGDEFVVVLPWLGRGYSAPTVAQHVIDALTRPFVIDGIELSISASIGISFYPMHGIEVDTLLNRADMAMYRAKESGRGRWQVFTQEMSERVDLSSSIETCIREGLAQNRFRLHYQPVVDLATGKVIAAEALLRLPNGDGEAIGPARFIGVAESSGTIAPLGDWVATEVCRQQQAWASEGLPPLPVAMNISPLQFRQRGFVHRLLDIVRASNLDPSLLQVEVTEGAVTERIDDAIEVLKQLHSAGIRIALDDFGAGSLSLAALGSLPLDKLKVDSAFVHRLAHDRGSQAVAGAIISMGQALGLEIVGEGVEDERSRDYLREHGCQTLQGNLISAPLPPQQFADWLRAH